jgi:hypothetical protein
MGNLKLDLELRMERIPLNMYMDLLLWDDLQVLAML